MISFADDRFLVTGGAGFLGQVLCRQLREAGVSPDRLWIPRRRNCDLTDPSAVRRLFEFFRPTVVIHLAAETGGIGANQAEPGRFFYSNMAMGLNVIEQARRFAVRKFVQVGTICGYPKYTPVPFREESLWTGYPEETNAPYGIAKLALLTMCQAYRQQYGFNAIYLLPANMYGPGDNFDLESSHVIPAMVRKCVEARDEGRHHIVCWGDGSPTRDFFYVEDSAAGILLATERYDEGDPMNLGTGRETRMDELVQKIAARVGFYGQIRWDGQRPNGQPRRCLDTRKAEETLGFHAKTSLDEGLDLTIGWFLEHVYSRPVEAVLGVTR